jgi:hypothetical protein
MDGNNKRVVAGQMAELDAAARLRLERDQRLSMSERLARLHHLCKQMTSVAGLAKRK